MVKKSGFFLKLLVVYVTFVFVYTSIVAFLFFYKNNELNKMELDNRQKNYFEKEKDAIDTKLAIAFNLVYQLEKSVEMTEYLRDDEDDPYKMLMMAQTLSRNNAVFSNLRFKDLGIMLAFSKITDDRVISYDSVTNRSIFFKRNEISEEQQQQIDEYFKSPGDEYMLLKTSGSPDTDTPRSKLILVKKDIIGGSAGSKSILVFLSFFEDKFISSLNFGSNEFLGIIRDGQIITSKSSGVTQPGTDLEAILTPEVMKSLSEIKSDFNQFKYNDYNINIKRSDIFDWSYIYITPIQAVGDRVKDVLALSVVIFIAMSVLGSLAAFLIAKRLYRPIENILKIFKGTGEKIEKDDLLFISEEAYKIKNANVNLKEIINNNRMPLRTKFLRDLVYGHIPEEELHQQLNQYDLAFLEKGFTIAILEIENGSRLDENFAHGAVQEIKTQTIMFFVEQIQRHVSCEMLELEYKHFALFISETETSRISKLLGSVIQQVRIEFDIDIAAFLGEPVYNIQSIEDAFYETLNLMDYRFFGRGYPVITPDIRKHLTNESFYYPMDVERDLINYAIRGKRENVLSILQHLFNKNFEVRKLNRENTAQFLFAIVATINRILQIIGKHSDTFFEEGSMLYLEMKMYKDEKDLRGKITMTFEKIASHIEDEENKKDREITNQLINYIHANYNRDVSQNDMAEYFNLSRGYICSIFKNATGENFKDYLNIYRVEMAKKILDEKKDIKIKELSELVGCNNINTFIRIFNRYQGTSPGQYVKDREHCPV